MLMLWLQRQSYLTVLEGCTSVDVDEEIIDTVPVQGHGFGVEKEGRGHVMKYLFDETIVHEICSYMSY